MSQSKIELNVNPESNELVIRQGEAKKVYDPTAVSISGTIKAPYLWISNRQNEFDHKSAHVLIDRDEMSITLIINESDHFKTVIKGTLSLHPVYVKFGINTGKYRTPLEMGEFIKMNRAFFENRQTAMELVTKLKNFKAKVDKEMEKSQGSNGDRRLLLNQTVSSNVPESFNVIMPIFKGEPKDTIEVEVYFNPDDLTCTLVSPQANELMEDNRDLKIDEVKEAISEIAPGIVIIEK